MLYQSLSKAVNSVLPGFDVHLQAELAGSACGHGPDAGNEAAGEGALAGAAVLFQQGQKIAHG